jgi:signal transduction histidine kinase
VPAQGEIVTSVRLGSPAAGFIGESWQVGIPVATRHGLVSVIATVPSSELSRGVATAWITLVSLGVLVIAAAVALALRMARELVRPIDQLAGVAHRLGSGDLDARAAVSGPPELSAVGDALNQLATRLGEMIRAERESLADLSHQLRTPLAALKLQSEGRAGMTEAVDRMEEAVDSLIREVRTGSPTERTSDLRGVMLKRTTFWGIIAQEQQRVMDIHDPLHPIRVAVSAEVVGALADALIENVLTHTPAGTPFSVAWRSEDKVALLRVEDSGPGFPPGMDPTERGLSGAGSTGLGLDIARKTAEAAGGRLRWGRSLRGGALVEVLLPLAKPEGGPY